MEDSPQSLALDQRVKEIYASLGDRNHVASISSDMANQLSEQGDLDRARRLLENKLPSIARSATKGAQLSTCKALHRYCPLKVILTKPQCALRKRC